MAYINITKGSVLGKVMCSCQETGFSPGFIANYLGDLGRITLPLALVQEQEAGSLADLGLGFQWTPLQGLAARPEGTSMRNSTLRPTSGDIKALCSNKKDEPVCPTPGTHPLPDANQRIKMKL